MKATCPVCACSMTGPVDVCGRCQTPHHSDCARFIGHCAIFACGAAQFVTRDLSQAATEVAAAIESEPPLIPVVLDPPGRRRPGLHRGVVDRLVAAYRLLRANGQISLMLMALLAVVVSPLGYLSLGILGVLARALVVILFAARARGKESSLGDGLALLMERGGRILVAALGTTMIGWALMGFGMVFCFTIIGLPIGLGLILLSCAVNLVFVLVPVVAAMGTDEEPENVLVRSFRLVSVDWPQAILGYLIFFLPGLGLAFLQGLLGTGFGIVSWGLNVLVWLLSTAYWLLFYMEARRMARDQE